jgi:hypothetical protein
MRVNKSEFINRVEIRGLVADRPSIYPLHSHNRCMAVIRVKTVFDAKGAFVESDHRIETYSQDLINEVISKLEPGDRVHVIGYLKYCLSQAVPTVSIVTSTKVPFFKVETVPEPVLVP